MVPVDLTEMADETLRSVDVAEEATRLKIFEIWKSTFVPYKTLNHCFLLNPANRSN